MLKTIEYKLYPNKMQAATLSGWLRTCCWIYNQALEHRIKAYERRGESVQYNQQQAMLTQWRARMESLRLCPVEFERDALRRVDRGMKAFFRRVKSGAKSGFPRFRSFRRYTSLECLHPQTYIKGNRVQVPVLGRIPARGPCAIDGAQRMLRILHRASGWYAQVLIETGEAKPEKKPIVTAAGIDVGLIHVAALSNGERIANPRWLRKSARKLRAVQRRVSRRQKGSNRRRKAVAVLRRVHEKVALRRRNFCHAVSTDIVRRFDLISIEDLNVAGMSRSRLGKSILDAAWATLRTQLTSKAECAGCTLVAVDPRGTSQECPNCGAIAKKELSERTHACSCGLTCDRDVASARVILARALRGNGGYSPVEEASNGLPLVASG